jgi:hypothetical protein
MYHLSNMFKYYIKMPIEIIQNLWLGDSKDAEQVGLNTRLIVNCTKNLPFYCDTSTTACIRIPVNDTEDFSEQDTMFHYWTQTDTFSRILDTITQEGHGILIHCQMGRQRSAATVAAFLMTNGMTKNEAIAFVKSKKTDAFFGAINFDNASSRFGKSLL